MMDHPNSQELFESLEVSGSASNKECGTSAPNGKPKVNPEPSIDELAGEQEQTKDSDTISSTSSQCLFKCEYCKSKKTRYTPEELQKHQVSNHSSEIEAAFKLIKCEYCKHYFNQVKLQEHQCKETIADAVSPKQNDNLSESEKKSTEKSTEGESLETPERSGEIAMKVRSDLFDPSTSSTSDSIKHALDTNSKSKALTGMVDCATSTKESRKRPNEEQQSMFVPKRIRIEPWDGITIDSNFSCEGDDSLKDISNSWSIVKSKNGQYDIVKVGLNASASASDNVKNPILVYRRRIRHPKQPVIATLLKSTPKNKSSFSSNLFFFYMLIGVYREMGKLSSAMSPIVQQ